MLDDAGSVVRGDVARGRTLIVDVGYHTVDLLAVDGLEPITRLSTGTNFGPATAWAQIGKQLNRPLWDVDQMILSGQIRDVEPTLRALAINIMGSIESLNERFDYYLTGLQPSARQRQRLPQSGRPSAPEVIGT